MHRFPRLLTIIISLAFVLESCAFQMPQPKAERIRLFDLLITVQDLPPGWYTEGPVPMGLEPARGIESAGITFNPVVNPDAAKVSQDVYRFRWVWEARRDFSYASRALSGTGLPPGWHFQAKYADESYISCTWYSNYSYPVCSWIARYDRLVTEFIVWLLPGSMSTSDMERMVAAVDQRAGALLAAP